MNIWHDISANLIQITEFTAVVSNQKASRQVLIYDTDTGLLRLDRFLDMGTCFPLNVGYVPRTCLKDGMPAEVILLCSEPIPPMTLVRCRPIGTLDMVLTDGEKRSRFLAVVEADERWSGRLTIDEMPSDVRRSMVCFFKQMQDELRNPAVITELNGLESAERLLEESMERYRIRFCGMLGRIESLG